jgi:hypothetical protein
MPRWKKSMKPAARFTTSSPTKHRHSVAWRAASGYPPSARRPSGRKRNTGRRCIGSVAVDAGGAGRRPSAPGAKMHRAAGTEWAWSPLPSPFRLSPPVAHRRLPCPCPCPCPAAQLLRGVVDLVIQTQGFSFGLFPAGVAAGGVLLNQIVDACQMLSTLIILRVWPVIAGQ